MINRGKKRTLALVMTLALMVGMLPTAAFATGEGPPCESHPAHTAGCGYAEAEGAPCTHECELCAPMDKENDGEAGKEDDLGYGETQPDPAGQKSTPSEAAPAMVAAPAPNSTIPGNGYSFNPDDGKLTVSSNDGTTEWRNNTNIDKAAVTSVLVEDGVDTIRKEAFMDCSNLFQADLPDSLEEIEPYAFLNCTALTIINFPSNVITIGSDTFGNCPNLKSLDLSGNTSLQSIGTNAFWKCTGLESLDLSGCDSLTTIGNSVFYGCIGLESLDLSGCTSLTAIGNSAFYGCTGLESLDLSGCTKLNLIGSIAFYGCTNLTSLMLSNDPAPTLGEEVFVDTAPSFVIFVPYGVSNYTVENNWPMNKVVFGAALSKLEISEGTLAPAFFPGTNAYTVSIPYTVDNVTFIPTAHASGAITVNGSAVTSGSQAAEIPLALGETKNIPVVVKNSDMDSRTYTISVTRDALVVSLNTIQGVTPPARGAVPVTAITETMEYTGTVKWNPDPGAAFAADTEYTATITLSPKPGYTLQGVTTNFFTVAGATATNDADSGVVKAVFPSTGVIPTYAVTVNGGTASPASASAGDAVTITATAPSGQRFTGWTGLDGLTITGGSAATEKVIFTMPAQAVEVTASFENIPTGGGSSSPSFTERAVSKIKNAKDGDTVKLDLPSNGKLPGKVLEAAAGRDITLEISAGKGVTWIVNGKDIPMGKLSDLNLKVNAKANTIPVTVINALTGEQKVMQLALSHNGDFPFPLTLRLDAGKENAGLFANLYYYNETAKELEYQSTAEIDADGNAHIPFAHASSYAVVIDATSHTPVVWENPFTDVGTTDWFYGAVEYVHQTGLMVGTTDTTFGPSGAVTRAQVWTVLARMDGREIGGDPWYAPAQAWAVANGVSDGTDPDGAVTREQFVTMLWRYAQSADMDVSVGEDTNILSYDDAFDVAEWAIPAFQWACGTGVVSGTSDSTLSPQAGATRTQLAAILQRFSSGTT